MWIRYLREFVEQEIAQKKEIGCDVTEIESRFSQTRKENRSDLERILAELEKIAPKPDFPYSEPSRLQEIIARRPRRLQRIETTLSESELLDRIHGGWLGRCAGCLLGKPVEGRSRQQIEEWLRMADAYPLKHFFPPMSELREDAPQWLKNWLSSGRTRGLLLGQIDHMPRDDDIDYTIIGLHILENYGPDFSTMNVGEALLRLLPYWQVYGAEQAAYRNLVNGIYPPESATYMNPYREFIGAQIRADVWGYVTPGLPDLASELAYRDARLSHIRNGIYGEMLVSCMISAAFTTSDIEEVINVGVSAIPRETRLAEAVKDVMAWRKRYSDWGDAWVKVMEKYGHYNRTHVINNLSLVLLGLLYGEGVYEKSITVSVMGGLDTDCNGATVGSILGVLLGAEALPDKWVEPLNDLTESFVTGYNNSHISDLAKRTYEVAKKVAI